MKKAVSLFLATLCVGFLSPNVSASERAEQGWQLIDKGAMIVDVRTPQEFSEGHLDNVPSTSLYLNLINIFKTSIKIKLSCCTVAVVTALAKRINTYKRKALRICTMQVA